MVVLVCHFFFFFQAEDGIRDLTVTGVQTCALPICSNSVAFIETATNTVKHITYVGRSPHEALDRKSTRLNSSHSQISYAVFCLKKKTRTFTVETSVPMPGVSV